MSPPIAPSASDSASTETRTDEVLNPSARSVAISRARVATAVYIVRIAPKTAPMPISAAMPKPIDRISRVIATRLRGVVFVLAPDGDVDLRVRREPVAERIERLGRVQLREDRLIRVPAAIGALQRAGIAPDFGFSHAAVGLEDTDHLPPVLARHDCVAEVRAHELSARRRGRRSPRWCRTGTCGPHEGHFVAHRHARWLDAAHRHVGRGIRRRPLRQIDDDVELGRRQRACALAPDARRLLDDVDVRCPRVRSSSRCRRRFASPAPGWASPDPCMAAANPAAIDSTETNTTTTPAIPMIATADELSRAGSCAG